MKKAKRILKPERILKPRRLLTLDGEDLLRKRKSRRPREGFDGGDNV